MFTFSFSAFLRVHLYHLIQNVDISGILLNLGHRIVPKPFQVLLNSYTLLRLLGFESNKDVHIPWFTSSFSTNHLLIVWDLCLIAAAWTSPVDHLGSTHYIHNPECLFSAFRTDHNSHRFTISFNFIIDFSDSVIPVTRFNRITHQCPGNFLIICINFIDCNNTDLLHRFPSSFRILVLWIPQSIQEHLIYLQEYSEYNQSVPT